MNRLALLALLIPTTALADTEVRSHECKGFVKCHCVEHSGRTTQPRAEPYRARTMATYRKAIENLYIDLRGKAQRGCKSLPFRIDEWEPMCWDELEEEPPTPSGWPVKP